MINFNFISPTISEGKSTRPWTRFSDHVGPTEHITPLGARVSGKTYCGLLSLAAGSTAWCAQRLSGRCNVSMLFHLVEAIFAYQCDWRYFNRQALPRKKDTNESFEQSMTVGVENAVRNIMFHKIFWKTGRIPDTPLFHLVHVIGYILPDAELKLFETWLYAASDRFDEIATRPLKSVGPAKDWVKPVERMAALDACHGVPFSPEVLDISSPYDIETREKMMIGYLRSLDWEHNPLLSTPTQMRESGFKGEPYGG